MTASGVPGATLAPAPRAPGAPCRRRTRDRHLEFHGFEDHRRIARGYLLSRCEFHPPHVADHRGLHHDGARWDVQLLGRGLGGRPGVDAVELAGRVPRPLLGLERRPLPFLELGDRFGVFLEEAQVVGQCERALADVGVESPCAGIGPSLLELFGGDGLPHDRSKKRNSHGLPDSNGARCRSPTRSAPSARSADSRPATPCRTRTGTCRRSRPRPTASTCGPGCTWWSPAGAADRAEQLAAHRDTRHPVRVPGTPRRTRPCGRRRRCRVR